MVTLVRSSTGSSSLTAVGAWWGYILVFKPWIGSSGRDERHRHDRGVSPPRADRGWSTGSDNGYYVKVRPECQDRLGGRDTTAHGSTPWAAGFACQRAALTIAWAELGWYVTSTPGAGPGTRL